MVTPGGSETILHARQNRRHFFETSGGFLGVAIGYLWVCEGLIRPGLASAAADSENAHIPARLPERIKSVIFLFMCGGVSHIDTFDPKDNKYAGKMIDAVGFGDNLAKMQRPVIPILRHYTRYGKSGIEVSDWFPNVGKCVDDIAFIRSVYTQEFNHFPAVIEMVTGHRGRQFNHPSLGSWIYYALGTANRNLPVFVSMGRPSSPVQLTGGYLGTVYSATPFGTGQVPVENLIPPRDISASQREKDLTLINMLNEEYREQYKTEMEIAARLKSYQLAARMQLSVPEVTDFNKEPQKVKDLYGIGEKDTDSFGRQLLLARRLAEKGVRFVQVCHGGGGNGAWDSHGDMNSHAPLCRETDQPIAGLISDLKQRGMLDSTLVVWATEFGRTPWSQNTTGRDHNPRGFTCWMAGGGVKGGTVHGSTDEVGFNAVEDRVYVSDLNATILHLMGLNHEDLNTVINNRPVRLVEPGFGPVKKILS